MSPDGCPRIAATHSAAQDQGHEAADFSAANTTLSSGPALSGGLSDRYGYKETIFASTVVKISGYLTMAFFPTYWGFFAGARDIRRPPRLLQLP